jgi:predicted phosphohydrolase
MRIFAIADPHLSKCTQKPMDVFGGNWEGHPEVFFEGWRTTVADDDLVLIPGDISWAMRLSDALEDLRDIAALPGRKVLLRGNHDYWWPSISKLRSVLPEGMYAIQNDALALDGVIIAGTRGWVCPDRFEFSAQDNKIYLREVERLKLSLSAARRLSGKLLIAMLHFPPTNVRLEPSGFTRLLEAYGADIVIFGHIHGETASLPLPIIGHAAVHFVAADALGFKPALIAEVN